MARTASLEFARAGAGDKTGVYSRYDQVTTLTLNAGTAVSAQEVLPVGAIFRGIAVETASTFGVAMVFHAGTVANNPIQIVGDTDVRAQGHAMMTVASTFDSVGFAASAPATVYYQLTAGAAVTGTVTVILSYAVPAI